MTEDKEQITTDPLAFRRTAGQFVTGVTVLAAEIDGEVGAMTVNSFTSLSLDPPLVLFCLGKNAKTGQLLRNAQGFSVNILRREQEALSTYFAGAWKEPAPPPFHFAAWIGGPRLEGCAASIACATHAIYEGGDHWIVIGRVLALHQGDEPRAPLVFYAGRYAGLERRGGPAAPDLGATTPIAASES